MTIYYEDEATQVIHGDCIEVMKAMPANSTDSIVTDPPYGLEFMGKDWANLKPGGKQQKMGAADGTPFRRNTGTPSWGASGNPTCINCGGDKYRKGPRKCSCDNPQFPNHMAEQMRAFQSWSEEWAAEAYRVLKPGGYIIAFGGARTWHRLAVAVEESGFEIRDSLAWLYGSGFPKHKSSLKPAFEPVVMARKPLAGTLDDNIGRHGTGALNIEECRTGDDMRWPANVFLDEAAAGELNEARFFYTAKASKKERPTVDGVAHPTVKPLDLMRWLVKLATPKGGTVLDPFAGSGTTIEACILEGFNVIGIEREAEYLPLISARVDRRDIKSPEQPSLFDSTEAAA